MSCPGSFRLKKTAVWVVVVLMLSMTKADDVSSTNDVNDGRLYFNNQNSTLIPLGSGGALLVSTVGIVALVIGAIFVVSLIFNNSGLKNGGGGLFSPWFGNSGYPQSQYYGQPQAQPYLYEPYSKLGYNSQPVSR